MKIFFSRIWDVASLVVFYSAMVAVVVYVGGFPLHPAAPANAMRHYGLHWPTWLPYGIIGSGVLAMVWALLNPWRLDKTAYGAASWATEKDIQKFGLRDDEGLIFGIKGGRYIRSSAPLSAMLYAPPGSGKTQGVVVPSIVSCGNSVITHDPKGELFKLTGPYRSRFSRVIRFSPGEEQSASWNPLGAHELPRSWIDIETHVARVCNSVFRAKRDSDEGSYWLLACRSVFMFWALYLIHKNRETGTSFAQIIDTSSVLNSKDAVEKIVVNQDSVQAEIEELEAVLKNEKSLEPDEEKTLAELKTQLLPKRIIKEGAQLVGKSDREYSSVVGTFNSYMEVFLDQRVAKNTGLPENKQDEQHLFRLSDLREERTSIYLTVKTADQERLKPIISLFFEFAVMTLISEEPTSEQFGVTLMLDEFVRLSRLDEVIRLPEVGRSYRVNALFVCQSMSQIVKIYGQAGADSLKNATAHHIVFSQNEARVAEEISKSIGTHTRQRESKSTSSRDMHQSRSESSEGVALITPQQIMSMREGEVLIMVQNHFEQPIKAQVALWFKDHALKKAVEYQGG